MDIGEQDNSSSTQIKSEKNTRKAYWLGKKRSPETNLKISQALKGRRVSIATEFKKGNPGPWLGKKRSPETVEKVRQKLLGRKKTEEQRKNCILSAKRGEENHMWKGDKVGYHGLHNWIRRHKGLPKKCEHCGLEGDQSKFEWANVSYEYKRDLNDFISLCIPCHKRMDKRNHADTNSVLITAFGETKRLVEWSEDARCTVSPNCLSRRIRLYGYEPERAITKPSIRP